MRAMVLEAAGGALVWRERPDPEPDAGMVRIRVAACGVCRTDLHVVDGELPDIRYPIVPGHEIVGRVEALGAGVPTRCPGSATPAAFAAIVGKEWKISATARCLPATRATAAMPPTPLPTRAMRSR